MGKKHGGAFLAILLPQGMMGVRHVPQLSILIKLMHLSFVTTATHSGLGWGTVTAELLYEGPMGTVTSRLVCEKAVGSGETSANFCAGSLN